MKLLLILCVSVVSAASFISQQLPLVEDIPDIQQGNGILHPQTRHALLDLHRNLVEIESITNNELDVGTWLASHLRTRNMTVELQEVESKRYNVLAYPGEKRATGILITSHIDTVIGFLLLISISALLT